MFAPAWAAPASPALDVPPGALPDLPAVGEVPAVGVPPLPGQFELASQSSARFAQACPSETAPRTGSSQDMLRRNEDRLKEIMETFAL